MISRRLGSDRVHTRVSIGTRSIRDPLRRAPGGPADEALILTNAWVVTRERAFIGTVEVMQQHIVAVYRGPTALPGAIDLDGDYLLPGLIELHTCNLCRHLMPRSGVRSSVLSAVLAHDAEMISAGITTAFGRLHCGDGRPCLAVAAIGELAAVFRLADRSGLTRSDHRLGLGFAIDGEMASDPFAVATNGESRSLETPAGHRIRGCHPDGVPDSDGGAVRLLAAERDRSRHDSPAAPTSPSAIAAGEAGAVGACPGVCVFPASVALAQAARAARLKVMVAATALISESVASAPHPGTQESALTMAAENLIDILSSDDYPPSLLQGAFRLHQSPLRMTLSEAIATVSATPAQIAGLTDRGQIAPGKRADLIRVRSVEALPLAREVWRAGVRVY